MKSKLLAMKQLYRFLFVGLLVLMATSCKRSLDSLSINEAETRLIGTWTITQVKNNVRGDGKWFRNDVTGSYRDWEISFNGDRTLTIYIPDENLTLSGDWQMYEDWSTDSDGDSEWNTFLSIYAYDPQNPEVWRTMLWEEMRISGSELRAKEEALIQGERVFYFYELRR